MKNRILEVIIIILLVAVLALQAVILVKLYGDSSEEKAPAENIENSQSDIDVSVVKIDTPFCMMEYPSDYAHYLKVDEDRGEGTYTAKFLCDMNGKSCELFTVTMGTEDKENSIGTIVSGGKEVPVAIKTAEVKKSDWTQEEYEIISEMLEGKSVIADSILAHEDVVF